jgi:uncharacterized membrane protein YhaH (DUF805 family)
MMRGRGPSRYVALVLGWILMVAAIVLFLVLWVRAVIDVVRRHDLSRAAKCAWAIIMLVIPFLGLLIYTLVRPSDAQVAQRSAR